MPLADPHQLDRLQKNRLERLGQRPIGHKQHAMERIECMYVDPLQQPKNPHSP
jgi:hypothetical protein